MLKAFPWREMQPTSHAPYFSAMPSPAEAQCPPRGGDHHGAGHIEQCQFCLTRNFWTPWPTFRFARLQDEGIETTGARGEFVHGHELQGGGKPGRGFEWMPFRRTFWFPGGFSSFLLPRRGRYGRTNRRR